MSSSHEREAAELNRRWWDERVPLHTTSAFYDVEGFLSGNSTLRPFELEEVGDVEGRSLLHLQCHFGLDTLSWARLGARVTGLDFSAPAVEAADSLARRAGISARFVLAAIDDAVVELRGERFEIVYTGLGERAARGEATAAPELDLPAPTPRSLGVDARHIGCGPGRARGRDRRQRRRGRSRSGSVR